MIVAIVVGMKKEILQGHCLVLSGYNRRRKGRNNWTLSQNIRSVNKAEQT